MLRALDPFQFVLIAVAGCMNQRQQLVIDYRREENRVLREQLGGKRLQLSDDERCRLAAESRAIWIFGPYAVDQLVVSFPQACVK